MEVAFLQKHCNISGPSFGCSRKIVHLSPLLTICSIEYKDNGCTNCQKQAILVKREILIKNVRFVEHLHTDEPNTVQGY